MAVKEILLLGNPALYEVSEAVIQEECEFLKPVIADLHDTLIAFRKKYGVGRAIAAPQIGIRKRLIYMFIDAPVVFINPVITNKSQEMITVWDDCMSFPELLVKVQRHRSCRISFRDENWQHRTLDFSDDLSELVQHEYDHLDGVLAVSRAIDAESFSFSSQKHFLRNYRRTVTFFTALCPAISKATK
ncbi:MAG: peptide deformylase [Calditrichaeota bacterium]|nr:MAG: peptide deformylase [Calditrichota bacterium]